MNHSTAVVKTASVKTRSDPVFTPDHEQVIRSILQSDDLLEFAVLVGSRALGTAKSDSDWDIALQWVISQNWMTMLGRTETLRRQLAKAIGVNETTIDLIDLPRANLAMRASVAEEGRPLKGDDSLAWAHFLQRTWRELEDYYWEKQHAA
jgi:predicted nucleotidyltransferase